MGTDISGINNQVKKNVMTTILRMKTTVWQIVQTLTVEME